MFTPKRGSKAFTLLELIVVIVILGILAAIAIPTFQKVIVRSQDSATETTLAALLREAQALAAFENRDVTAADIEAASEDLTIQAADAGVYAAGRRVTPWADGATGAPTLATRTDLLYKVEGSVAGVSLASASGNCVFGQVTSSSSGAETWVGTAETCTGASAAAGPGNEVAAPVVSTGVCAAGTNLAGWGFEGPASPVWAGGALPDPGAPGYSGNGTSYYGYAWTSTATPDACGAESYVHHGYGSPFIVGGPTPTEGGYLWRIRYNTAGEIHFPAFPAWPAGYSS